MIPFDAAAAVAWTGGRLLRGEAGTRFTAVSTDTRAIPPGSLFVAIRGPRHDAHAFLADALAAGARGLLVERADAVPAQATAAVVEVADTTAALGALAAGHRASFAGPVVAITGSNGKTTTKEMCAAILSLRGPTLRNRGNLNNAYGLPLTLLERDAEHWALVVEIGMNHRGEIAPLAAIARPSVGVITNVGTAHIEHLGSQEEIALEKGDLLAALAADGVAVVNADDPRALAQAARSPARRLTFGLAPGADVRAEDVRTLGALGFAFELVAPEGRAKARVAGLGEPAVSNALAAAAAALAAGARLEEAAEGLAAWRPVAGRMEQRALPSGVTVIDDTYNANPQSMAVALRGLAALRGAGRALAVLGDMGELGETAAAAHRGAGRLAGELGLDWLFALGPHAELVAAGAREAGLPAERVVVGRSHEELASAVARQLRRDDWVLVKGSRSMRMERIVAAIAAVGEDA